MNDNRMDFFDQRRYKINKQLLKVNGLWPNQKTLQRDFFFVMTVLSSATLLTVQIRKVVVDSDDTAVIIESVAPFIVHLGCVIKVVICVVHADKVKFLLQCIENDWNAPMGAEEKVLARFSDDGRKFSLAYAVLLYCSMVFFLIVPFTPKVIVALGWANLSTAAVFAIPVDYFVDSDENLVYIQIHLCIAIFFMITIYIAVDTLFVVFVQHASGVFSAIGYRLEHLIESEDVNIDLNVSREDDKSYWTVIDCIKKHKAAIEFVDTLADMYSGAFLFLVLFNIPVMSFTGLQVIWNLDKPAEALRQGLLTICELFHLFFECYFSQRLSDHSLRIFECLTRTRWYMTSIRTRKLVNFAMMRSKIPMELRAGNLYIMSMENFSSVRISYSQQGVKVVRTSMSYFTLLCSM